MAGSSEGLDQLSQVSYFLTELLDLGGGGDSCRDGERVRTGVRDIRHGGRGYLHQLICQSGLVPEIFAMVGVATSITLSASSATLFRSMRLLVDASTIRTLAGNRWRKCSQRKELTFAVPSLSPKSCCMRLSSCVGLQSPSSSPLMSCCSLCCSEAAVRLMSWALRVS